MIAALHALLGISVLLLFFKFIWKPYALDKFRQDIFSQRNRLFELALKSDDTFSFEHAVYNKLWDQLNGLIHFGYLLSGDFLFFNHIGLTVKIDGVSGHDIIRNQGRVSVGTVPSEEVKEELNAIQRQVSLGIFRYLITTSPLFILFTISVVLVAIVSMAGKLASVGFKKIAEDSLRPAIHEIKNQALEIETLEEFGCLNANA